MSNSEASGDLFGHPRGLTFLFGTEMWERFSYYGMRVLLPIYCLNYLLLPGHAGHVIGFAAMKHALSFFYGALVTPQQLETAIYGSYTSLAYGMPLIGGILADRWLGRRYTVVAGGILMAFGHFLMAFENYFYFALLLLVLGNGGFKPNISTQVGGLYKQGDHRIDRAYSIFYVGINLGALIGQNICDAFGDAKMWSYGFGAAGVGMLIGTLIYLYALRILPHDRPKRVTVQAPQTPLSKTDWRAVFILGLLFVPGCVFWMAYEQSGNTVEIWSEHVNRLVALGPLSFKLSVGFIQSTNSIFILAFTPLLVWFWHRQEKRQHEPSPANKMALGYLILAASYLILAAAQAIAGTGQVHWIWPIVYFGVYTVGELYFSPVGLSLYFKAAPKRVAALMMAVFLATSFPGNYLAGLLGTYYSLMSPAHFFLLVALVAALPAPIFWAFDGPLKRLMQRQTDEADMLRTAPYRIPVE